MTLLSKAEQLSEVNFWVESVCCSAVLVWVSELVKIFY